MMWLDLRAVINAYITFHRRLDLLLATNFIIEIQMNTFCSSFQYTVSHT